MTRKDYQLIANAIATVRSMNRHQEAQDSQDLLVHVLSCALKNDNSLFDAAKFRAACQVKVGK